MLRLKRHFASVRVCPLKTSRQKTFYKWEEMQTINWKQFGNYIFSLKPNISTQGSETKPDLLNKDVVRQLNKWKMNPMVLSWILPCFGKNCFLNTFHCANLTSHLKVLYLLQYRLCSLKGSPNPFG